MQLLELIKTQQISCSQGETVSLRLCSYASDVRFFVLGACEQISPERYGKKIGLMLIKGKARIWCGQQTLDCEAGQAVFVNSGFEWGLQTEIGCQFIQFFEEERE